MSWLLTFNAKHYKQEGAGYYASKEYLTYRPNEWRDMVSDYNKFVAFAEQHDPHFNEYHKPFDKNGKCPFNRHIAPDPMINGIWYEMATRRI